MPKPRNYSVHWAKPAAQDLASIVDYIALDHPANASAVLDRIRGTAKGLTRTPQRGRVVPELSDQGIKVYRELVVAPWRIVYRIVGRSVVVLAVVDSRRRVEDLLLRRLSNA